MQYSKKLYAYFLALVMGLGSVFSCPLAVGTEQTVVALTQKPPAAESSRHPSGATAEPEKQGTIAPVSEAFEEWAQAWLKEQSEEALAAAGEEAKTHLRQPLQAAPSSQTGKSSRQGQGNPAQTTNKGGAPSLYFPLEKIQSGLIPSPLELERPSYFAKVDKARRGGDPELENLLPALQTARPLRSTPLGGSLSEEEISRLVQQKRFSLVEKGHITPIKDQGQEGNCWAFATMATIEGNWHKDYNESLDLSERHLAVKNGFNLPVGGNMMMANGYLGLRKGPVSEKSLPYSNDKGPYDGTYPRTIQIAHSNYSRTQPLPGLRQAFKRDHNYSSLGDFKSNPKAYEDFYKAYLDYIRPIQERNVLAIKRQLITQGVVSTALYSKPDAVKDDIYAYTPFDSQFAEKNDHAVAIVGWDDSISKENFTAFEERYPERSFLPSRQQLPHRDGAFICKNSWGPDKCDQGYFYISYDDLNVGSEENCSFTCVPNDPAKTTWYHGKYGTSGTAMPWRIPSVSEIYYGNYFSNPRASKGGKTELIDSVTLDFVTYDTDYKVYILTDLKDPSAISVAGKKPVVEGRIEYAGVKNIPLPTPGIQIAPGTNFAVIVYAHFDEPAANPIAVERTVNTQAYDENNRLRLIKFTDVTSEANQSFVSRDGKTFEDCKRLFKDPIHLQVKAHSHPADEKPTPPTKATKSSQPASKATTAITTTTTTKAMSTPTSTKTTEDTKGTNVPSPTTNIPGPSPKPTKSGTPSSKETVDPNPTPTPGPTPGPQDPVPTPEFDNDNKIETIDGVDTSALEGIINIQLPVASREDLGLDDALGKAIDFANELPRLKASGETPSQIQKKVDAAVAAFEKAVKQQEFAKQGVVLKLVTNLPERSMVQKDGHDSYIPKVFYAFTTNQDIVNSHIMTFSDRYVTVKGQPFTLVAWDDPTKKSGPVGARLFMALKSFFAFGADPEETLFTLQGNWQAKPQMIPTPPALIVSEKLKKQAQAYVKGGNQPVTPSAELKDELAAAYHIDLNALSNQQQQSIKNSREYEIIEALCTGSVSASDDGIRKAIDEFDAALQSMNFADEGVVLKLRTNLPAGLTVKDAQNKENPLPAYKYQFYKYLDLAQAKVEDFRDKKITDSNDAPWVLTAWKGDDKTVPGPFGAGPQAGQPIPVQGADDQCLYSLVGEWAQDSKPREVVIDCNDLQDQIARHPNQKPTPQTLQVTFNLNYDGAPAATVVEVEKGKTVERPQEPKRAGYIFQGWSKDMVSTTYYNFTENVNSAFTLYAQWKKEGTTPTTTPTTNPDPTSTPTTNPDPTTNPTPTPTPTPTKEKLKVTFDYNYDGAPAATVVEVKKGKAVTQPKKPERAGYSFQGWSKEKVSTTYYDFTQKVNSAFTLYAQWKEEGTTPTTTPTTNPDPTSTPTTNPDPTTNPTPTSTPQPPTPEKVQVSFNLNYDGAPAATVVEVEKGKAVERPQEPKRAGYIFQGWSKDQVNTTYYDFTQKVNSTFTLYAQWKEEGTTPTTTPTTNPDPTSTPTTNPDPTTNPTPTSTPQPPTPEKEKVSFNLNYDGAPTATVVEVEKGKAVTQPKKPERAGYSFLGWSKDQISTTYYDFTQKVNSPFTLYAQWQEEGITPNPQPDWQCTDLELYHENGHFYVRVKTLPKEGHKKITKETLQLQLWSGSMELGSYQISTGQEQIIQIEDTEVIRQLNKLVDGTKIVADLGTQPTKTSPAVSTRQETRYWLDRTDLEAALDLATDGETNLQKILEKANKTEDAQKFAEAIADLRQLKQEMSEPNPYTQAILAERMKGFRDLLHSLSYEDLGVVLAYHANLPDNIIQEPNSRIPAIQHYAFLTYDQIKDHQYLDMIARYDYESSWRMVNGDPLLVNVLNDGRDLFYLTGWSEKRIPVKAGTTPSGIRLAAPFLQQILLGRPVEAKSTDDLKVVDLYAVWSTTKNAQGYKKNTHTPALDSQAQRKTSTVPSPTPTPSDSNSTEPSTTPTPSSSNPTDPSPTPSSSKPAPEPSSSKQPDPSVQPTDPKNNDESTGDSEKGMSYDGRKDGASGSRGSRGRKEAVLFVQRGDRTGNILSAPANNSSQAEAGLNAQNSQVLADQAAAAKQQTNRINAGAQTPGLNQYQNQPGAPVAANNVPQTGERSTFPLILILSLSAVLLILKRQRIRP